MVRIKTPSINNQLLVDRSTGLITSTSRIEVLRARILRGFHKNFALINYLGISRVFASINKVFRPTGITVIAENGFSFEYPSGDYYWDRLLDNDWRYEPEIEQFLRTVGPLEFTFFDFGANFGFWSTRAAQHEFGAHAVIAVEASSESIPILRKNLSRAIGPSTIIHRIVDSTSKNYRSIYGKRHAGMSVVIGWDGDDTPVETIETMSVDDLFEEAGFFQDPKPAVCKIDIEGAELLALQGAHRSAETDVVFILEETGNLVSSITLSYAREVLGLELFVLSENGAVPAEVWGIQHVNTNFLQAFQSVGLNVLATKSPYWLSLLNNQDKPEIVTPC
jgi:FkbM family methyltransferase